MTHATKKDETMTSYQDTLINLLADKEIEAKFNGNFLNCIVKVTNEDTGKVKRQTFSFVFDSGDDCQGARLLPHSMKGTLAYCETFAKQAAGIIFAFSSDVAQVVDN